MRWQRLICACVASALLLACTANAFVNPAMRMPSSGITTVTGLDAADLAIVVLRIASGKSSVSSMSSGSEDESSVIEYRAGLTPLELPALVRYERHWFVLVGDFYRPMCLRFGANWVRSAPAEDLMAPHGKSQCHGAAADEAAAFLALHAAELVQNAAPVVVAASDEPNSVAFATCVAAELAAQLFSVDVLVINLDEATRTAIPAVFPRALHVAFSRPTALPERRP